jgi:ferredoxin
MTKTHTIVIHNRQTGTTHTIQVPEGRYILHSGESQGIELPFSCRNGACTTCAVRVKSGQLYQPEALGLSPDLQKQGYALLCVSYALSDLEVETQDEDEVYELQFGRYFAKGKVKFGLPLDED